MELIKEIVEMNLIPENDFISGYANLTGIVEQPFGEFHFGISIGKKLDYNIIDSIYEGPNYEYYILYKETNEELSSLSQKISDQLNHAGINSILIEPSVSANQLDSIYSSSLRTRLSHKMVATRAGLGWIGKSDLFVSEKFGPRLRLVTILTDTPLQSEKEPINSSLCGDCCTCVINCPAGAANGKSWNISIDRDEFFDAHKCREMCKLFGEKTLKMDVRVCGICVAVCPKGKN